MVLINDTENRTIVQSSNSDKSSLCLLCTILLSKNINPSLLPLAIGNKSRRRTAQFRCYRCIRPTVNNYCLRQKEITLLMELRICSILCRGVSLPLKNSGISQRSREYVVPLSLLLLPGPLWSRAVVSIREVFMSQIKLFANYSYWIRILDAL